MMLTWTSFILYIGILTFSLFYYIYCDEPCLDISSYVWMGKGPADSQFWSSKVEDAGTCATMCVRRAPCRSFTYNTTSGVCEMNKKLLSETTSKTGQSLIYSEFSWWPSSVDTDCYSRPCADNEVCVPGLLANGNNRCSYTCMRVSEPVCPLPPKLNGRRTVGSVNNVTCKPGYIGGGIAECLSNRQWNSTIEPCVRIHKHACTDNTLCERINGLCINDQCACDNRYDVTTELCIPSEPLCPETVGYSGPRTVGSVHTSKCEPGYTGGGTNTCYANLTWNGDMEPCTLIYNGYCDPAYTTCLAINGMCKNNQCVCESGDSYNAVDIFCETVPVCPPITDYNGTRTVGSVHTVNCEPGFTGGGTTTCTLDLIWVGDIAPCELIYNGNCDPAYTTCLSINGMCVNNQCVCETGDSYNSVDKICETVPVCPPIKDYTGTRTVGSVHTVNCEPGFTGGGTTTCTSDLLWVGDIAPCELIYNGNCDPAYTTCLSINGMCVNNQCVCESGDSYNSVDKICETVPVCPPITDYTGTRTVGSVHTVNCEPGFTGGGTTTCSSDLIWVGDIAPCELIYNGNCDPAYTTCLSINGMCVNNQCVCESGDSYNNVDRICETVPVCPPIKDYTGTRTVGSVHTVNCEPGFTGGGTTTCSSDLIWVGDIAPCESILGHQCDEADVDSPCVQINGICDAGVCACPLGYLAAQDVCEFGGECDMFPEPDGLENTYYTSVNAQTRNYTCLDYYYPISTSPPYTLVECTSSGWVIQRPAIECYTCGIPAEVAGAQLSGSPQDRRRTYTCDATENLYPRPGRGNGTISCAIDSWTWHPDNFQCYGVRLEGTNGRTGENTGFVQLFLDQWANVCVSDINKDSGKWGVEETSVICRDLNPSLYMYGGTYHGNYHGQEPQLDVSQEFDNIECVGSESCILDCPNGELQSIKSKEESLAITCFTEQPRVADDVYLQSSPAIDAFSRDYAVSEGRLIVVYQGTVGVVCGSNWGDAETKVACKSINPLWRHSNYCDDMCKGFDGTENELPRLATNFHCSGEEEHLKYCRNSGWNFDNGCTSEIKIKCTQ